MEQVKSRVVFILATVKTHVMCTILRAITVNNSYRCAHYTGIEILTFFSPFFKARHLDISNLNRAEIYDKRFGRQQKIQ